MLGLEEQVARIVRQRHLVLALERLRAGVGLIVARSVAAITQTVGKICLRCVNLTPKTLGFGLEFDPDRGELALGPRIIRNDRRGWRNHLGRNWGPRGGDRGGGRHWGLRPGGGQSRGHS